jgi:uridylate kinase
MIILKMKIKVMDITAFLLSEENNLSIIVFNIKKIGTLVSKKNI